MLKDTLTQSFAIPSSVSDFEPYCGSKMSAIVPGASCSVGLVSDLIDSIELWWIFVHCASS